MKITEKVWIVLFAAVVVFIFTVACGKQRTADPLPPGGPTEHMVAPTATATVEVRPTILPPPATAVPEPPTVSVIFDHRLSPGETGYMEGKATYKFTVKGIDLSLQSVGPFCYGVVGINPDVPYNCGVVSTSSFVISISPSAPAREYAIFLRRGTSAVAQTTFTHSVSPDPTSTLVATPEVAGNCLFLANRHCSGGKLSTGETGGVRFALPKGTRIFAPYDGTADSCRLYLDDHTLIVTIMGTASCVGGEPTRTIKRGEVWAVMTEDPFPGWDNMLFYITKQFVPGQGFQYVDASFYNRFFPYLGQ